MLKHKKTVPLFSFQEGQKYYPPAYFHFHATDFMKQYLECKMERNRTCYKVYRILKLQLCTYHLYSAAMHNAI